MFAVNGRLQLGFGLIFQTSFSNVHLEFLFPIQKSNRVPADENISIN